MDGHAELTMHGVSQLDITRLDRPEDGSLQQWSFPSKMTIRVGRAVESDVRLEYDEVSRVHAIIFHDGEKWTCSCIGRNGTFCDGRRIENIEIQVSRVLQFAPGGTLRNTMAMRMCLPCLTIPQKLAS